MNQEKSPRRMRVFIGSSTESMEVAQAIKEALSACCDCVTWYEDFFFSGDYVFSNLIQKIITFDYAIMIGGKDDRILRLSNGTERLAPRDNVYIEFGLFSGTLSPKRVLFLKHRECVEASDLKGMLLDEYTTADEAVELAARWVGRNISGEDLLVTNRDEIDLLPTVGVAIGYYYSFVEPLAGELDMLESLTVEGIEYPVSEKVVHICIPTFVSDQVEKYMDHIKRRMGLIDAMVGRRRVMLDPAALREGRLTIYDIPTTLRAVFQTVNYIFNNPRVNTPDMLCAKHRALDNFFDIIARHVADDFCVDALIEVERYEK